MSIKDDEKSKIEEKLEEFVNNEEAKKNTIGPGISPSTPTQLPWERKDYQVSLGNQIGWIRLPIKDLPSMGLFYPEGTEIAIRAATAGEIRHWSTIQEEDLNELDNILNYVLERCATFKVPEKHSSWKDLKEVDRFYILLAIREFTFIKGENNLQVKISETKKMDVTKEMIDYMNFDEKLMKYYDDVKRCFVLKFKSGKSIEVTIPSIGVTGFLKNYVQRKRQGQQSFDMDFIPISPFVIKEWRGLNDNTYEQFVIDSNGWTIEEISVLTHLKDLFVNTFNPVIKYVDEGGAERTAPLSFLGGIKSIFLISDPFGQLV
jgi:hypothetical protein